MKNKREELMSEIDGLTDGNEDIVNTVKDFIDSVEEEFKNIATLLEDVTICKLANIEDAFDIADSMATALY